MTHIASLFSFRLRFVTRSLNFGNSYLLIIETKIMEAWAIQSSFVKIPVLEQLFFNSFWLSLVC